MIELAGIPMADPDTVFSIASPAMSNTLFSSTSKHTSIAPIASLTWYVIGSNPIMSTTFNSNKYDI